MNKELEYGHLATAEPRSTVMRKSLAIENTLTRRQTDVIELLTEGLTNQAIGDELLISEKTVKTHLMFISSKLGTDNRAATAVAAVRSRHLADNDESFTLSAINSANPDLKERFRMDHPITDRDAEIVALVAEGMQNRAIARKLFISEKTVKAHLVNIYAHLGISNRTALAVIYAEYIFSRA